MKRQLLRLSLLDETREEIDAPAHRRGAASAGSMSVGIDATASVRRRTYSALKSNEKKVRSSREVEGGERFDSRLTILRLE